MKLRLMTYNIHKGIGGVDRRYDPGRLIETIEAYDPDILMLQEVDNGVARSCYDCQVDLLGDAMGYEHRVFQVNVHLKQGHYGNAILSRFALPETWDLDLTVSIKKQRRAQIAKVHLHCDKHSKTLLLCNTHLGLAGFERTLQIKKLLACEPIENLHHNTPAIIGGDFNDVWSSHGRKLMTPQGFQCAVGKIKTFPAIFPVRSLDAIYYRGNIEHLSSFAGRKRSAKHASDHLPLIADFEIG